MFKVLRKWWKYMTAKLSGSFDERADPKVQLEQAIMEAQEQHRRLREQAANVIANQKQAEMRLNRSMDEYEKLSANTRQAILMADEASKTGDQKKMGEYTNAAESFANRLIAMEGEIEQASMNIEAQARLSEIRAQLGIDTQQAVGGASAETSSIGTGTPAAEPVSTPQPQAQPAEGAGA